MGSKIKEVNVGFFGLGTVASWTIDYLQRFYDEEKTGIRIHVKKIVVKNPKKNRSVKVDGTIISTDRYDIIDNPDIDVGVELMGGLDPAREIISELMKNGKDVVTANKAVLATYPEIFIEASKYGRHIGFQASVCGEMRVLDVLSQIPSYRDIKAIVGILNSTSNFILTKMNDGMDYQSALVEAQNRGFTEANPSFDVEGIDAAQKLVLMSMVGYGVPVDYKRVHRESITKVTQSDIKYARNWNYLIKPLAIIRKTEEGLELRVHPTLVPSTHPLAYVGEENNAVSLYFEDRAEPLTIIGKGAGRPTARSIVTDIVKTAKDRMVGKIKLPQIDFNRKIPVIDHSDYVTPFSLRFLVEDNPGVLGRIATILGNHGINIAAVTQVEEDRMNNVMPMALKVGSIKNSLVYTALEDAEKMPFVKEALPLRIYD